MPQENLHSAARLAIDLEPCGIECWGVGGAFFCREGRGAAHPVVSGVREGRLQCF